MNLQAVYLEIPAEQIAYVKFIFESYEDIGIIRTADRKRSIIVLLAAADFIAEARKILDALKREVPLVEIPRPADITDDWLMAELENESSDPQT